ncbi:uncharacterized protein LOC126371377 [Pectinophora gossypiella]|uniref:uncharacterized protein LOC126371377 n=1 Tax=Pectinophora gossypiella TaxID=13191 RepID=UPI00214E63C9|nr:uncharacterized protein LOC126371377 [Pectinophora gossypiella]
MSSEEYDDSLKYDASVTTNNNINNVSISATLDRPEVITKCLTSEPHRAQHRNEIPCCSNASTVSVIVDETSRLLDTCDGKVNEGISEFIVIDLTCDVKNFDSGDDIDVGTNCAVECDNLSIDNLESSQSLVPVNHELVRSDSQKLVSLSLSILLAALLQAMRCFAQFLEDIVVPQR